MTALSMKKETGTTSTAIVTVEGLHKTYKGGTKALQGLDLNIQKGDLYGIIGPDGAGKTTALHIICGVMAPSSGKILVNGKDPAQVAGQIGYVPQNGALYPELTVDESLKYEAGLHNVSDKDYEERRKLYLGKMGLEKFGDRLTSQLSGGMKQKLALCCALINEPTVLVLDEPTNGLDPVSRRELWQALSELTQNGMTAIVATPFLDEAERCSKVAMLHNGKVHLSGTPKELKAALNLTRLDLEVESEDQSSTHLTELSTKLDAIDQKANGILDIFAYGDHIEVLTKDIDAAKKAVESVVSQERFKIKDSRQNEPSMENVFVMRLRELGIDESPVKPFPGSKGTDQSGGKESAKSTDLAISAKGLNRKFENFEAVKSVDLELKYGEIYGLLGANGAGKTTTIKMLCGLLKPSSGQISLAGESGDLRSRKVRKSIGYMSQKFTLYDALTVRENLEFYSSIYEIPKSERKAKLDWAIESCHLQEMTKSVVGSLPRGWKQRIAFGAAVMHEPSILFLDEPTAGVDPIARRQIWSLVRQLARSGTAVLVTTHYLDEAEYCSKMALMADSKIVAQGSPSEIKAQCHGSLFRLKADNIQETFLKLSENMEPWRVSIFGDSIHILLDKEGDLPAVQNLLGSGAPKLTHIPFSLEDAFIDIVQKSKRENSTPNTGEKK